MIINSREIGSEFWNIPVLPQETTNVFSKEMRWFLSGRVALEYIVSDIKARFSVSSVAMPSWCCDSMIIPFLRNGIEVLFYTFDDSENIPECDVLFFMEHFGYIRHKKAIGFHGIVIYDVTHSMFSENFGFKRVNDAKAQYFFGSLRKWAGFKTAGFAGMLDSEFVADMPDAINSEYIKLRTQAMLGKEEYITGKTDAKDYLKLFSQAEELLDLGANGIASDDDVCAATKLDVDFIKKRRRDNAAELLKAVSDVAIYPEINDDDCPLFVPIRLKKEKRDALRKYLINNDVFCPIHWPLTEWHKITTEQKEIYDEELSLVCDQRYTVRDMQYVCELINNF